MRGGRFGTGMNMFMSVHRQTLEADHAARARLRAYDMQRAMRNAEPSDDLGNARLADNDDIEASGLFGNDGIFLGGLNGRLLFFNGDGPLITFARTGAGKGRDLILPNLAHLRGRSLVVVDVKDGENFHASHEYRAGELGEKCIVLNPYNLRGIASTKINPLQLLVDIVASGGMIDSESNQIAQILLPPPAQQSDNSWARLGALRLLATRMEYLAHFGECTLGNLWRFVNSSTDDMALDFAMMTECGIESIARKAAALNSTRRDSEKQWAAYQSECCEALNAFEPEKSLATVTSAHEFDFGRLKHEPHTVYLILPSDKLGTGGPWISLIINETIAKEVGPVRTTFLLDEFAQLPPIGSVLKALRLYRGKGIQLWMFSQGRFSLRERWNEAAAIEFEDQAAVVTMRSISERNVIRDVEMWSGNMTILKRGVSHNGGTVETAAANLGESKRSVLQAEDILGLGLDRQIIKVATMPRLIVSDCIPFYAVDPWKFRIKDVRDLHRGFAS
jgi:type IV secretion system protein VirD4